MQHRSLIKTRALWFDNSGSEQSLVRNHSPYCEATGPIVQEGFVASRIRALQALSTQASKPSRSHSPMLSCPPPWLHDFRNCTPPRPGSPIRPIVGAQEASKIEETKDYEVSSPLCEDHKGFSGALVQTTELSEAMIPLQFQQGQPPNDLSESHRSQSPHSDITANEEATTSGTFTPSDASIISPRAIPASLAAPAKPWNGFSRTGSLGSESSHRRVVRPRTSIADKLGSMVERGWVGCDVFGKTYNDRHAPESVASNQSHNEPVEQRSLCLEEQPNYAEHLLTQKPLLCLDSKIASNARGWSELNALDADEDNPTPIATYNPPMRKLEQVENITPTRKSARRSNSDAEVYGGGGCHSSPSKKRRLWSLRHPTRLRSSHSQQFELDRMGAHNTLNRGDEEHDPKAIKHFLSSGTTVRAHDRKPEASSNEHHRRSSETASLASSSRRASTKTTQSAQSATRSASWFKKYRFLPKLVPVDNPAALWDFSRSDSPDPANVKISGDSHQDLLLDPDQHRANVSKMDGLAERGCGDMDGETDACPMEACVSKEPGTIYNAKQMSSSISPDMIELPITASPPGSEKSRMSERLKSLIVSSPASSPLFADDGNPIGLQERDSKTKVDYIPAPSDSHPEGLATRAMRPSESSSTTMNLATATSAELYADEVTQGSPASLQSISPIASVKLSLDKSPESVSPGFRYNTPRPRSRQVLVQRDSSDVIKIPLEQPPQPILASSQVDKITQTVRRERRPSEKKIKKIQVTITLDGAEELVIEAKLQKKNEWEGCGTLQ